MIIKDATIEWNFDLDTISFKGKGLGHDYYRNDGYGPGGFVEKFPLPLHWFVFSVGTAITEFEFYDKRRNIKETGTGTLHMEKNWGRSFPDAWIWTQGHNDDE